MCDRVTHVSKINLEHHGFMLRQHRTSLQSNIIWTYKRLKEIRCSAHRMTYARFRTSASTARSGVATSVIAGSCGVEEAKASRLKPLIRRYFS